MFQIETKSGTYGYEEAEWVGRVGTKRVRNDSGISEITGPQKRVRDYSKGFRVMGKL